ncbi:MAG TPA: hypothetical protein VI997_11820, partial [Candidatus Thermoplasmatota archaeon]|nr:hypothetical protein [Candidatus Thermoplasmatota archaeon]
MRRAPSLVALAVLVVGAFPVPTSAVDEPAARAAAAWFRAGVLLDGAVAGAYSAEERAAAAPPNDNFTFADAALVQWLAPGLAPLGDDLYAWRARPDAPSPVDWWRARAWATTAPGSGNPCNDWSRAVLALVALGEDPRAFGGTDHVAKVLACHRGDGTWDDPTTAADDGWSNNDAFALLALRAAGYPVDDAAVASTVAALVATQHADGGFAMHGEPNSLVDDTAMITTALLSVLPPSHDAPRRALL